MPCALSPSRHQAIIQGMRIHAGGNMKALIFLPIALAASLAHAQQPTPCLKLSHVKVDRKVLYQDGTTEVRLNFKARDCYVLTESVALGRQRPIVELQNEPGLKTQVGAIGAFRFDPDTAGATIFRAREITATLNLTATQEATLGQRKVPGTVRYKIVDRQGNVSDEVLSFDLPIKVKRSLAIPRPPGFQEHHPVWTKTVLLPLAVIGLIALLPVAIVLALLGVEIL
jgi:hypothetical protein